ncbi:MAG: cell division protein SepF [Defluviitaleaceae bacterium]|nr:cell division protein SepF [Defluviitaleaceae bacterium]
MSFVEKFKNILLGAPDVDDYDDEEFFEEESSYGRSSSNNRSSGSVASNRARPERPVLTLVDKPQHGHSSQYAERTYTPLSPVEMIASTISPKNCEEAMLIIDRIKDGNFVIFSLKKSQRQDIEELTLLQGGLEENEEESRESVFKFICGGIYTLNAEISKFDEGVFIAGPYGSKIDEISTDFKKKMKKTGTTHAFKNGLV